MSEQPRYRPGEQPYDTLNGMRIGAIVGALSAAIPAALLQGGWVLLMIVGAGVGAWIGARWAKREAERL